MSEKQQHIPIADLRGRSIEELGTLIAEKTEEHRKQTFKHALGQLQKTHALAQTRREIAQLNTVLAERRKSHGESL